MGSEHGTIPRVASQLGYGVEPVRSWVRQAYPDDADTPGLSTVEARRILEFEQEDRKPGCANEILRRADIFIGSKARASA